MSLLHVLDLPKAFNKLVSIESGYNTASNNSEETQIGSQKTQEGQCNSHQNLKINLKKQNSININFIKQFSQKLQQKLKVTELNLSKKSEIEKLYKINSIIFKNHTAIIYEGVNKSTGKDIIIKKFYKKYAYSTEIPISIEANKVCKKHVLPVEYTESFQDEDYYLIVMPKYYVSLYQFMSDRNKPLTFKEAKYIFKQVLETLIILQNNSIYHLDIKEENILVHPDTLEVKLIDFGGASKIPIKDKRGSPEFAAPEIMLHKSNIKSIKKHDVWSLGVALYSATTGVAPYHNIIDIINGNESMDFLKKFKNLKEYKEIYDKIFVVDFKKRASLEKLKECAFFK